VVALEPAAVRQAEAHLPGTVEHLLVTAGRMRAGPLTDPIELLPGDYVRFAGDAPHLYQALEPATSAVLIMEHV
jgi:quercetin dioxygenase-like cupin family protein